MIGTCPPDQETTERLPRLARDFIEAARQRDMIAGTAFLLPSRMRSKDDTDRDRAAFVANERKIRQAREAFKAALITHGEPVELDYREWVIDFDSGDLRSQPLT